ncbi:hypothetical protein VP1G_10458, partial [Cytospora mali]
MDKHLRLRLVIRRNGLPDTRILFNVPLGHDPTIANLVELVNETIPLETEEWGLEDYAVELHDKDGNPFECLHFQPVASVLDKDDKVFIRPLLTDDLKKRRLSGRIQIAHGGQHLIDGVPYGRPRLRAPRARPAVHIAPRKRRRITYDGDFDQDDPEDDYLDDEQEIGERYVGVEEKQQHNKDDEPLRLTQNGEPLPRDPSRRVRFTPSLTMGAHVQGADVDVDDADDDEGEGEGEDEDNLSDSADEGEEEDEEDDIQEELRGLAEEAASKGRAGGYHQEQGRFHIPQEDIGEPVDGPSAARGQVNDFGNFSDDDNRQQFAVQLEPQSMVTGRQLDLKLLDKITAIRSAFPAVSTVYCEELLVKHNRDVSSVWKKLAQQVKPRLDLAHTMVLNTQLELHNEIQVLSSPISKPAEVPGEVSRIEEYEDEISSGSSDNEEGEGEGEDEEMSSFGSKEDDMSDNESGNHSDSDSDSSSSESESGESESKSSHPASRKAAKQQRKQDSDSDSSSDGSSDAGAHIQQQTNTRRRRNVIELSPKNSQAVSGIAGTARGLFKASSKTVSSSDDSDSPSSEESHENSREGKECSSSSPSSSDFDTDTSSSSESGSDAQVNTVAKTKKTTITPRSVGRQTASSVGVAPPSAAYQASDRTPVPPGQGLTRTQKRNARRRLQKQKQATSGDDSAPKDPEGTRDADLIAKKAALLQSLGTSEVPNGRPAEVSGCNDGSLPSEDAGASLMDTQESSETWRHKISYRAVECIDEGVQLSEPPFPFVQRWDPQQRHRRGKRKPRNDTQFYDDTNRPSAKRRKFGPSRQLAGDYYEDTAFRLDQEDVTLNYDDVSFNPEDGSMANDHNSGHEKWDSSAEDNEDDLPLLSEDLSSVPSLHPEDLQPGMVIAWKQLLMSKATNWQPVLSDYMTAVVIEVEEGASNFKVQLAKRNREINDKEYDEEGQRIYGKFEAPDDDADDAEEDLGFRDLFFADMTDPRIVQQPTQPTVIKDPPLAVLEIEVADSQPNQNRDKHRDEYRDGSNNSHGNNSGSNSNQSTTLDHENEEHQLINDGGFRQGVTASIDQSAFLRIGSPSRQLEEEASLMLCSRQVNLPQRTSSEEAPSEYGSKDTSQQASHLPAPESVRDNLYSASPSPSPPLHYEGTSGPTNSTGRVDYPSLNASFTSQNSAQSGRQFDPNFVAHSDDLGIESPDDSVMMDDGFDDDDDPTEDSNIPNVGPGDNGQGDREQTPTQQIYREDLHNAINTKAAITPLKSTQLGSEDSDDPGSRGSNSTRSSSIFLDLELIGSQPAKIKFQEQIKEEPLSTQDNIKGESLSQPSRRMSQLPNINKEDFSRAASSRSPEKLRKSSVNGTPRSSRRARQASLLADSPSPSPATRPK